MNGNWNQGFKFSHTKQIAPCKDCTRRYVGCHGECNYYKDFHKSCLVSGMIAKRKGTGR